MADVAVAGDFERVLSFGIGLRRPAGLHVTVLNGPPRLVIDVRAEASSTLVWPTRTLADARRLPVAAFEVLTLSQRVCPGNPRGLWNVADVAR